jgi:hypothetical protein
MQNCELLLYVRVIDLAQRFMWLNASAKAHLKLFAYLKKPFEPLHLGDVIDAAYDLQPGPEESVALKAVKGVALRNTATRIQCERFMGKVEVKKSEVDGSVLRRSAATE